MPVCWLSLLWYIEEIATGSEVQMNCTGRNVSLALLSFFILTFIAIFHPKGFFRTSHSHVPCKHRAVFPQFHLAVPGSTLCQGRQVRVAQCGPVCVPEVCEVVWHYSGPRCWMPFALCSLAYYLDEVTIICRDPCRGVESAVKWGGIHLKSA